MLPSLFSAFSYAQLNLPRRVDSLSFYLYFPLVVCEKRDVYLENAIEVKELTKSFGALLAVDHVNFEVKGKEIFAAKCALCHGEKGDGKGPGSANLPLKPADLTDAKMVAEMPGNFWVWRVSEGGLVEPFRSKGSAMPAWKGELSMQDRWAVIAYAHTLSGHRGPHEASEHPQLRPKPKFVTGEGTVVALRPDKQQLVLEHGEIKDFMEAMTMGYKITPPSLLNSVKAGDKVRFTIDTEARAITKIDKLKD